MKQDRKISGWQWVRHSFLLPCAVSVSNPGEESRSEVLSPLKSQSQIRVGVVRIRIRHTYMCTRLQEIRIKKVGARGGPVYPREHNKIIARRRINTGCRNSACQTQAPSAVYLASFLVTYVCTYPSKSSAMLSENSLDWVLNPGGTWMAPFITFITRNKHSRVVASKKEMSKGLYELRGRARRL